MGIPEAASCEDFTVQFAAFELGLCPMRKIQITELGSVDIVARKSQRPAKLST
jgi:hypothetical protein